ncbi:SdpI/YhfL family protein [Flavobacterium cutihirudinis]|uniref:SdpI/YhfL family protein n=1 Tax=Flavobacterium cutihirudinis TaxID=1265740 RepID=A0A3D9FVL5_9FLAO|nr:SdpI family protein [Flavobacterium cutihirudinis]RED24766.1 SdpI/YhfL family protein [Flavobacterium cutihirudinis]
MTFTLILFTFSIIFIFVGLIEYIFPPKDRNQKGYRTKNSLGSQERWDFAQKYSAKMIIISALCSLIISIIGTILHLNDNEGFIAAIIVIVFFIFFIRQKTERAIKNKFD